MSIRSTSCCFSKLRSLRFGGVVVEASIAGAARGPARREFSTRRGGFIYPFSQPVRISMRLAFAATGHGETVVGVS